MMIRKYTVDSTLAGGEMLVEALGNFKIEDRDGNWNRVYPGSTYIVTDNFDSTYFSPIGQVNITDGAEDPEEE